MGKRRDLECLAACAAGLGLVLAAGCGPAGDDRATGNALSTGGGEVGEAGDDEDDDDDDDVVGDDEDEDDDDEGPDDQGEGPDDDDNGNGEDDNGDEGPAGSCDLDMEVAIRVSVDVTWDGGIAVLAGGGSIQAWLLGALSPAGSDVHLTGRVCRLSLPDFETGVLAGGEKYGTLFPDAIWNAPLMPSIDAFAQVSSADPGATLTLPEGAVVLGATLADPIGDPWPAMWDAVMGVDHDGDGNPGITSVAKTGNGYAFPRIDILNSDARAEALFVASRTIMVFDGTIDTCDSASGSATMSMENHAMGCRVLGGGACTAQQTGTLDNNLPVFQIQGGSFELARLPDGANCGDVFTTLP